MNSNRTDLKTYFETQQDAMLEMLHCLAEIESPSHDKAALDRMGARVADLIEAAGGRSRRLPLHGSGDLVLGHWDGRTDQRPILILCHMDTVWPLGTLAERPVRVEDGRLYGPGAFDMKGGIVVALTALRGLMELGLELTAPINLLCTSDEEIGSDQSRDLIEELARNSRLVLCLEPGLPGGVIKTARKGCGTVTIRSLGKAAHAGGNHQDGINAIQEMAHQVLALQTLTDYQRGTTVSVGTITGGSADNVVPAICEAKVDFRVVTEDEGERITAAIHELRPQLTGARLEIEGGLNRPPMVRDEQMVRTFQRAQAIAERHGIVLQEGSTGGGSDGNFTAALGVPTLDGLGVDGAGAHAIDEHVVIASLPQRATLLAAILSEWD